MRWIHHNAALLVLPAVFCTTACNSDRVTEPTGEWRGLAGPVTYATGDGVVRSLKAGDATGDGLIDLIVVTTAQSAAGVMRGAPDGTFAAPAYHAAGSDLRDAATGDFNGDGIPDLAGIGHFDNALFVLPGTGNGNFAAPQSRTLQNHGRIVGVARLNGDRFDDVFAAHDGSGQPIYADAYLGSADGLPSSSAWAGTTPFANARAMDFGDFNGDGTTDVVITTGDDRASLLVYYGTGGSAFSEGAAIPSTTPGLPDGAQRVATADLDGDGRTDIVATHYDALNALSVRLSTGAGFGAPDMILLPGPFDIVLADIDRDGHTDAVVSHIDEGVISLLWGEGTGAFAQGPQYVVGPAPVDLVAGDFNRDGWIDIAVADIMQSGVRVLLNRGRL